MPQSKLAELEASAREQIDKATSPEDLESVRVEVLGRKGALARISKDMGNIAPGERAAIGKRLNEVKQSLESALEARQSAFADLALRSRLDA